jgi:hypothetical protein
LGRSAQKNVVKLKIQMNVRIRTTVPASEIIVGDIETGPMIFQSDV